MIHYVKDFKNMIHMVTVIILSCLLPRKRTLKKFTRKQECSFLAKDLKRVMKLLSLVISNMNLYINF